MSSAQDSAQRTVKAKKPATAQAPSITNPGHSGPTTFFLRSEKEMEKRGRKTSRDDQEEDLSEQQKTPMGSLMGDSAFGVQSLENTITGSADEHSLSRTNSNMTEQSVEAGAEGAGLFAGRKRKAGNPVHPKIVATGQRILSGDQGQHTLHPNPGLESPASLRSAESPFRHNLARRGSASSSLNLSQPLTPLRMSPHPESAMPSTPRSGSPKSFRLSDEEASVASDTGSQAIQSSSSEGEGDDEDALPTFNKVTAMPQLVMPSIAMPTRRPFTDRGRRMGRLKVMVIGAKGVGKTSLIQSICRACEDVVHVDPITSTTLNQPVVLDADVATQRRLGFIEVGASTRHYPAWWTDFESRRTLLKRKSIGDGVLERNLTFLDTPGLDGSDNIRQISQRFERSLSRTASLEQMNDSELISMLSGDGGVQIDAVLYLFDPAVSSIESPQHLEMDHPQAELLRYLCKWTNVIPLIGRADTVEPEELAARKKQLLSMFDSLGVQPCLDHSAPAVQSDGDGDESDNEQPAEPYAISSAVGDDPDVIDASTLMSSSYLQPLVRSELEVFVNQFLEPENVARLRHLAATKFLLWRQEHLGSHLDLQKQLLLKSRAQTGPPVPARSPSSLLEDPSKVLVPHGSSSYFRSASPSESGTNPSGPSAYALGHTSPTEPFRQVRLAKWAQDLQRSLDNERRRYQKMYMRPAPSDWTSDDEKEATAGALVTSSHRPGRGRLGGALGIIDPRDPLGVLAFSQAFRRRGFFALQVAGGAGLLGAVCWWVLRNWVDVQEWLGVGQEVAVVSVMGVPAPTRGWLDQGSWKGWLPGGL